MRGRHNAEVGVTQEIEPLRLAQAARRLPPGGMPPELDQPRLALVRVQSEQDGRRWQPDGRR
jgi:hypothetical protein